MKANIGHADTAAGTAGLIKVCAMLQNNLIPGQVNFTVPNAELHLEQTNFEVLKENRAWLPNASKQRLAGVSSFGVGGTNAHVIIGDYRAGRQEDEVGPGESLPYIIPVSAKSRSSLEAYKRALMEFCENNPLVTIRDIAYTLQERREHFKYRSAFFVRRTDELISTLSGNTSYGQADGPDHNSIVFMFPGQGVQYIHMARELYESESVFQKYRRSLHCDS